MNSTVRTKEVANEIQKRWPGNELNKELSYYQQLILEVAGIELVVRQIPWARADEEVKMELRPVRPEMGNAAMKELGYQKLRV